MLLGCLCNNSGGIFDSRLFLTDKTLAAWYQIYPAYCQKLILVRTINHLVENFLFHYYLLITYNFFLYIFYNNYSLMIWITWKSFAWEISLIVWEKNRSTYQHTQNFLWESSEFKTNKYSIYSHEIFENFHFYIKTNWCFQTAVVISQSTWHP